MSSPPVAGSAAAGADFTVAGLGLPRRPLGCRLLRRRLGFGRPLLDRRHRRIGLGLRRRLGGRTGHRSLSHRCVRCCRLGYRRRLGRGRGLGHGRLDRLDDDLHRRLDGRVPGRRRRRRRRLDPGADDDPRAALELAHRHQRAPGLRRGLGRVGAGGGGGVDEAGVGRRRGQVGRDRRRVGDRARAGRGEVGLGRRLRRRGRDHLLQHLDDFDGLAHPVGGGLADGLARLLDRVLADAGADRLGRRRLQRLQAGQLASRRRRRTGGANGRDGAAETGAAGPPPMPRPALAPGTGATTQGGRLASARLAARRAMAVPTASVTPPRAPPFAGAPSR